MRKTILILLTLVLPFALHSQVCINEYVSSNINGILDEDQSFTDWIEIYNSSSSSVNITGYGLSDEKSIPLKWTFPVVSLPAGKQLLVFASGKDRKQLPMSFQTVIDMGDQWHYLLPSSDIGTGWRDQGFDDSSWPVSKSGFGFGDGDDSTEVPGSTISIFIRKEFTVNNMSDIGRLVLCADYDDGFVAYINGHEVARVNLGNVNEDILFNRLADAGHEAEMYLGRDPAYFEISDVQNILHEGTNVIAIQIHNLGSSSDLSMIPFLSVGRFTPGIGDISPWLHFAEYGGLHTNFKIDKDSEIIYLSDNLGNIMDSTLRSRMFPDISMGRKPDGAINWRFFATPTPGVTNYTVDTDSIFADTVRFSANGGMHSYGFAVLMSTPDPLDTIYYTTDGSIPTRDDLRYSGPVNINSSKVIRARAFRYDRLPGAVSTRTFVTGLNHDLPIVCLTTSPDNLWDENYGMYAYGPSPGEYPYQTANFWQDWERPVYLELYDTAGVPQLDQLSGAKIFGAWSRASDQKSMALFARKSYGKGSFKYQLFSDKPIKKFESFILRNSGNDNMGLQFHDCFMTGLTREMDVDRQAYQPAAVYLNGEYWGLLNIREKVSVDYVAENHHVNADSVNLLEGSGDVIDGSNESYYQVYNYLSPLATLQNESDYQWVSDRIDIDNFIQYQLTEIYLNNRDWPGNNIKFWNTVTAGSKWRWILYDTDFGFGIWNVEDYQLNTVQFALEANYDAWPNPSWSTLFLRRLVSNPGFRNNFITQFCDRLNMDFHPDRVYADLDSLQNLYDNEMVYTFNRWWSNMDEWQWRINNRKIFGLNRPGYCRQHLHDQFALGSQLQVSVQVSDAGAGTVKLNTIYLKRFPFSGIYFQDIPVTLTAIPKPGYKFVKWEGSVTSTTPTITYNMASSGTFRAVFAEALNTDAKIIINEINYKSSDTRDTKDWIELYNNGNSTLDMSGFILADSRMDSAYYFPQGTYMSPGDYLVICRDLDDFKSFNPGVGNSIGNLTFGLGSEGDIVRLFDNDMNLIDAVNFGAAGSWPNNAAGTGYTIELKETGLSNDLGENWHAVTIGGTPGVRNTETQIPTSGNPLVAEANLTCFPNPFRDYTTIRFEVAQEAFYNLEVTDIQGRVIKTLAAENLTPGAYFIDWMGEGASADGGVYIIRLTSAKVNKILKVVKMQ